MKKCIIIGGGPAGLTAGYELLKKSDEYEAVILEQSNRLTGGFRLSKNPWRAREGRSPLEQQSSPAA